MKKILILALCFGGFCSQEICGSEYLSYVKQLEQSNGDSRKGEIQIVLDPMEILHIQKTQENRLLQKGYTEEEAKELSLVGIVCEDSYWIWLRDAVYFPNGASGTYNRLLWKHALRGGPLGVAVLPILPSGHIVLNLHYRHATRCWELELPKGGVEPQETAEEAALRELKEETGYIASSLTFLGEMAPDTGVLSSVIPVFIAKISSREEASPEDSEVIADVLSFSKEEIQRGLVQGFLEVSVQGELQRVPLRDSFLTFALLQAELRKVL